MYPRILTSLAFAAWLTASVAGMAVLWNYESQPGAAASAPQRWPADSRISPPAAQSVLLVWLHPQCPCSRATIAQLERLMVHIPDDVHCQVVLTLPPEQELSFIDTGLTRSVRQLPVTVFVDNEQLEAKRFGVSTSGQVLMYGPDAKLLFAGGITAGRGHEGDNLGASKIRELFGASQVAADAEQCCVFGCELFAPSAGSESTP